MKQIQSNEELKKLHAAGNGLIYNDFSGRGRSRTDDNILHAASCIWVTKSRVSAREYFFDSLEEATIWLERNRGAEGVRWRRCKTCGAGDRSAPAGSPKAAVTPKRTKAQESPDAPFAEAEVEGLLIAHLQARNYSIETQVQVHSGIIDVVAEDPEGRWIIEVKGEDRGGYASAQMNFQMGIGQLVSRMTDPKTHYALAFPMTPDFARVLTTYQGTVGFGRLGLWFFVVHRDGRVHRMGADEICEFIGAL